MSAATSSSMTTYKGLPEPDDSRVETWSAPRDPAREPSIAWIFKAFGSRTVQSMREHEYKDYQISSANQQFRLILFINKVYSGTRIDDNFKTVDSIYDFVLDNIIQDNIILVDEMFRYIDPANLTPAYIISLLMASAPAKEMLSGARGKFFDRAFRNAKANRQDDLVAEMAYYQ